jgi:riboflavin synthase
MFTGITRGTFPVTQVVRAPDLLRFSVDLGPVQSAGLVLGASVSVDGVCQTVVAMNGTEASFEAVAETLRVTTLDALQVGQRVAIERSARVGDEIGGHDVSGHVRGTGTLLEVRKHGATHDVRIGIPGAWMKYVLPKGFIAVDGSSLTVGATGLEAERGFFEVHLIPETLRLTNFGYKSAGDRVNIELDPRTVAIVETVERVLAQRAQEQR